MTPVAWVLLALAGVLAGGPRPDVGRKVGPAGSPRRRRRGWRGAGVAGEATLPLVLDLAAAALRAGRPLPEALLLAAPAAADPADPADSGDSGAAGSEVAGTLRRVAGLLRLGAEPRQAWGSVATGDALGPVVPVAVRSAASGIKLAGAFERLAGDLRAERAARAAARAQRAGIFAMAPLAACFLPSFVCLGVIPVVVGLAARALGGAS